MESMNHSNKLNLSVIKITQILISVTAFSFLVSQSSLVPILVHSYDYLLSNFNIKFKLFTYTTERNCIFLLCNGILVLIIQSSGLISKITPLSSGRKGAKIDDHHGPKDGDEIGTFQESEKKGVVKAEILEEKTRQNEGDNINNVAEEILEGVEDEDEDIEGIDRDELNKKCEDFIKKVKQEILMIQK